MPVTADQILEIVAAETGIDRARLTPEATLAELDINSLDVVSALFALEDQFGIDVEPDSIPPGATLGQLITQVQSSAGA